MTNTPRASAAQPTMLNKVPEITAYFWIVKVLSTTVGETAADFLNTNLNLGLTGTSTIMALLLAAALVAQFRARTYIPGLYWLVVVLISVVGTLITDNLVDNLGVPLQATTALFAVALAATFVAWYAHERTVSIHTINTGRRETYYWLAILFTFALGTAAGDLVAEGLDLGFGVSALIFAAAIGLVTIARYAANLNTVLAFWIVYVLTRPLGASLGDYLSQSPADSGLGLGTIATSALFLLTILSIVGYLSYRGRDTATAAPSLRASREGAQID